MTNRQWIIWKMIDMSDEDIVKCFGCEMCREYVTSGKPCPSDCNSTLLAWLKKEHGED